MRIWLKQHRKKQGLTQAQVAASTFINRAYYSQIEQGTRNPSIDVAKAIADKLGFNPSRFFAEEFSGPYEVALKNAPIIIAHCDMELRYTWVHNPHPDFRCKVVIGKRDDELGLGDEGLELLKLKESVIREGKALRRHMSFILSDGMHTYSVFAEPMQNEKGEAVGVVIAMMELLIT